MLRLTKKADYGLMALKYLAEQSALTPASPARSAKDIAEAYHIPPQLLAKILQTLARAGLLVSHAGSTGGYALARPALEVTAFEVIRAIDGAHSSSPVASPFTEPATLRAVAPSKNHCARSTTASRIC
jgi:Rrf2 family protein